MGWPWKWVLPLSFFLLCFVYLAVKILDVLWWKPRRLEQLFAKQGIRGPKYHFFLGCVNEMVALMMEASSKPLQPHNFHNILPRVLPFYSHWKKIYGSTFLIFFGPTPRVAISDPELVREVLLSRSEYFDRYESHPLVRQLEGKGLVSLTGDKWFYHRKVLTPTFHMDNLKFLIPYIGKTMVEMADKWTAMSNASVSGEVEIDVSEWLQIVTEDAITRTAFGRSYEDGKAVFQLQTQLMVYAAEAFQRIFIPGYRFIPTKKNASAWKLDKEIKKSLVRLIGRRTDDDYKSEKHDENAKDLLGLMINASTNLKARQGLAITGPMTLHDIVEECKTFFFAGKQTTSNLLTWATVLLAMHPDWQDKARKEVIEVCGEKEIPTKEHLHKLKTLGMILSETLRLYPPAVATIRRAKTNVELGGYMIPQDTELLIPIMALHHDTEQWGPDAGQFNPARFEHGIARAVRHPTAYIPFGLGSRMCIGQNLAILEAKLTMSILLQRFNFRVSPKYVHAPKVLMLLYPEYGAPVVFRPIKSDSLDRKL
ncbi:hypothetical protein LUZ60_009670 [Juncus effusus]|nr:hypothetical protein LUZ60_009670 [Juncus effusus]